MLLVIDALDDGGMRLSAKKSVLCTTECKLLGHIVQCSAFTPNLAKLHKLALFSAPTSLKQLWGAPACHIMAHNLCSITTDHSMTIVALLGGSSTVL